MRKKFVGPVNPDPKTGEDLGHAVVVAGHDLGTVRHGDVVEVPAVVAAMDPAPVWPGELWEDVKDSPKRKGED